MSKQRLFNLRLVLLYFCFFNLNSKSRADYLYDLAMLDTRFVPQFQCFESPLPISDQTIFQNIARTLDAYDILSRDMFKIFNVYLQASREKDQDCKRLSEAIYLGLKVATCWKMLFVFDRNAYELAQRPAVAGIHECSQETEAPAERFDPIFDKIVRDGDIGGFSDFLQNCINVTREQGNTNTNYILNVGFLFIDILLNNFIRHRNIEDIDLMACALLGGHHDHQVESYFQSKIFGQLINHFIQSIRPSEGSFISLDRRFSYKIEKIIVALSEKGLRPACLLCSNPLISSICAPDCNPGSFCHPACLKKSNGSCPFCRGAHGSTFISPDSLSKTTLKALPSLEKIGSSDHQSRLRSRTPRGRGLTPKPRGSHRFETRSKTPNLRPRVTGLGRTTHLPGVKSTIGSKR